MRRRELLRTGVGAGVTLGLARALHNTVIGYGQFGIGENLTEQHIGGLARAGYPGPNGGRLALGDGELLIGTESVRYREDGTDEWTSVGAAETPESVQTLTSDIRSLQRGEFDVEVFPLEDFFEWIDQRQSRPTLLGLLRRQHAVRPDRSLIDEFTGIDPGNGKTLLGGLAEAFAESTTYDIPRYAAGSVQDNLLPVDVDLRGPFRPDIGFEQLVDADGIGLFCGEYTLLTNRALRSVPPADQSPPLRGLTVYNDRHKHVYNGVISVVESENGLVIPVTFVDYTFTTLRATVGLDNIAPGEKNAYGTGHRADRINW